MPPAETPHPPVAWTLARYRAFRPAALRRLAGSTDKPSGGCAAGSLRATVALRHMQAYEHTPITISMPQGFTIGGVTTWALATARRFAQAGRRVRLVAHPALDGHTTFDATPSVQGLPIDVIDAPPLTANSLDACVDCYAELLPSVLLPCLCPESYAVAARLSRQRSGELRVVGWVHGDNPVDYAYLQYYEQIVHRYVAVSRRCATEMQARLPHRAGDIAHIPCGVDVPPAHSRTPPTDRPLRVVYAGRMELGIKRTVDVLAIAHTLATRGVGVHVRLVGDGPHAAMIDARIAALAPRLAEMNCSITRDPPVPPEAMPSIWKWADVAILASRLEGLSVAMIEAMAAGCVPVVSRVASGVDQVIHDGVNGLTFPVGDVAAAADRLARLAEKPSMFTSMSEKALASAIESADMGRYVDGVRSILDAARADAPRGWPVSKDTLMPPVIDPAGAIPLDAASETYESVVDFIMSRPDASRVVIYGLGVNGLTLIERLRADPYLGNRSLVGVDDHAHAAVFAAMDLPRWNLEPGTSWPRDAIGIVTPNGPAPMVERLLAMDAEPGVDFVCLHPPANPRDAATPTEKETMAC